MINRLMTDEKKDNLSKITDKMIELRQKHGYTQTDIAKELGTSRSYISHIEIKKAVYSIHYIIKYFKLFNIDILEMIQQL